MKFYAYIYLRQDGTPYYIGKGMGNRAYIRDRNHFPPKDKSLIQILNAENEESALETEKFLIRFYGRISEGTGCLRNLVEGGENPPNRKGIPCSPETIAKRMGNKHALGMCHTAEAKARVSASLIGNKRTLGHKLTEEHKAKIGRGLIGNLNAHGGRSKLGQTVPADVRAKISASRKALFARRRAEC